MTNAKTLEAIAELKAGKGKRHASVKAVMADMNEDGRTHYSFPEKNEDAQSEPLNYLRESTAQQRSPEEEAWVNGIAIGREIL